MDSEQLARTLRWRAPQTSTQLEVDCACRRRGRFERALDRLWLAYQPIVSWSTRRVVAYEALCRSAEPGLQTPDALLDEAEALERVWELGRAVRARVADLLSHFPTRCALFVNLHTDELSDPDLFDPNGLLAGWADRVVLEITERRRLADLPYAAARTRQLSGLGYGVAVDDLGAGYSGLGCLAAFAPDVVKIDRSLVSDIHTDSIKQTLVESVVELCKSMRVRVIAEGVETHAELDALLACGCDWMQGYLFGMPSRNPLV